MLVAAIRRKNLFEESLATENIVLQKLFMPEIMSQSNKKHINRERFPSDSDYFFFNANTCSFVLALTAPPARRGAGQMKCMGQVIGMGVPMDVEN